MRSIVKTPSKTAEIHISNVHDSDAKLTGSRLAPPTRNPSISGCAMRLFALSGLTLPPYKNADVIRRLRSETIFA
jgi:hypothetical protein